MARIGRRNRSWSTCRPACRSRLYSKGHQLPVRVDLARSTPQQSFRSSPLSRYKSLHFFWAWRKNFPVNTYGSLPKGICNKKVRARPWIFKIELLQATSPERICLHCHLDPRRASLRQLTTTAAESTRSDVAARIRFPWLQSRTSVFLEPRQNQYFSIRKRPEPTHPFS